MVNVFLSFIFMDFHGFWFCESKRRSSLYSSSLFLCGAGRRFEHFTYLAVGWCTNLLATPHPTTSPCCTSPCCTSTCCKYPVLHVSIIHSKVEIAREQVCSLWDTYKKRVVCASLLHRTMLASLAQYNLHRQESEL